MPEPGQPADGRPFDLLVLGDVNPDLVLSGGDIEPAFGQVERLVGAATLTLGGSGAITACAAARLGLRTALAGVVGADLFGRYVRGVLTDRGVDVSALRIDPERPTGVTVVLARPQDRAILTAPGTIASLRADDVPDALLERARHVHISSFYLQSRLRSGLPALLARARRAGGTTSLDPNWDPTGRWDGVRELGGLLDVLMPNRAEALRLTGGVDVGAAAHALSADGPLVAVKLGADGALAVRAGEMTRVPAVAGIDVVDGTGAGDAFDAGLMAGRLWGWPLERALALGCVCGALSTRRAGGIDGQPTREEALARLAS